MVAGIGATALLLTLVGCGDKKDADAGGASPAVSAPAGNAPKPVVRPSLPPQVQVGPPK